MKEFLIEFVKHLSFVVLCFAFIWGIKKLFLYILKITIQKHIFYTTEEKSKTLAIEMLNSENHLKCKTDNLNSLEEIRDFFIFEDDIVGDCNCDIKAYCYNYIIKLDIEFMIEIANSKT